MRRRVEEWNLDRIQKERPEITFPEYQRQPNLWSIEKKRLLIDSIIKDFDIPKIYLNQTNEGVLEVVDGTQRLWSIWGFLDDDYEYEQGGGKLRKFSELPPRVQQAIRDYTLQVTIFDDADDDDLRELFVRLQLGLLLVTGEKLHAASGMMKDFVFRRMRKHPFVEALKLPVRRYSKETFGAQIAVNSFAKEKIGEFARTRYEDLRAFLMEYEQPLGPDLAFFRKKTEAIIEVLGELQGCFGSRTGELTNRSYIVSTYLFFEEIRTGLVTDKQKQTFVKFVLALWGRLRQELRAGIDRKNRELYTFETMLSSAPGERYQIERRHGKLKDYFEHFKATGKIRGD